MHTLKLGQAWGRPTLDGFDADLRAALSELPVEALLADFLDAPAAGPADRQRSLAVVDRILAAWSAGLDKAIDAHPPGSMPVLSQNLHKLEAARTALQALRQALATGVPAAPVSPVSPATPVWRVGAPVARPAAPAPAQLRAERQPALH